MKYFIELKDIGDCVYKLTTSEETLNILETENEDFKRGATFGMAWAFLNINSKCKKYLSKEDDNEGETYCE